jgi:hypothetical protein
VAGNGAQRPTRWSARRPSYLTTPDAFAGLPKRPFQAAALSRVELLRLQPASALVADLRALARNSVRDRAASARVGNSRLDDMTARLDSLAP